MSLRFSIEMILAIPMKILGKNDVTELSVHKFITTDTFRNMLLRIIETKKDLTKIKQLTVVVK